MAYSVFFDIAGSPASGWADDKFIAQYKRVHRVVFDSPFGNTAAVGALPEWDQLYQTYPSDPFAGLKRIVPRQSSEDPAVWDVEFEYSRVLTDQRQFTVPLSRPPRVTWDAHLFDKSMNYDINGDLICNSAGDPIVGATMDDSRITAVVTQNLDSTPQNLLNFRNKINASSFTLDNVFVDKKCAKIQSIRISDWHNDMGQYYREASVVVEIRDPYVVVNASIGSFDTGATATVGSSTSISANFTVQGWQRAELDQGWSYFDGSNKKTKFLDDYNMQASQPGLLNGVGGKLAYLTSAVGTEYYRVYDVYPAVDFSPLNLPQYTGL